MVIDIATVITIAGLITALTVIVGSLAKVHNWYLKQEEQGKEIADIKSEQRLSIEIQFSILDGLEQLGCNHTVPAAKRRLEEYLNEQAHK